MDRDTLRHRIDDIPEEVRPHIRMGFRLLSQAGEEKRREFIQSVLSKMLRRESLDSKQAADILGVTPQIIGDVLAAVSIPVGATMDISVKEDEFLEFARGKLFDDSDAEVAREVTETVMRQKEQIRGALDESALANAVLPSFRSIAAEVDLRLKFDDDGGVAANVPIAVLVLDTDTQDPLSFQATRNDVARMIDKLEKIATNMDRAATLSIRPAE
jgi:hypothetical protein